MATEVSSMPNGNYAPQHGFDQQHANNAYASQNYNQAPSATNGAASANTQPEIPKDEVGWYFVEQYYTTLSRTPEKLYLYYNKRSQFVSGNETDKVQVCVGQRAINDRIKELEFQDCKVRITNVDSQASDINIVIQVIGEISNKSQPHRKFTQTFVLATQTNGYFVLNDIFRYMIEEEEETAAAEPAKAEPVEEVQQESAAEASGVQEPAPTVEESEPKTLTSSEDASAVEHDAQTVDKELEEKVLQQEPKEEEAAAVVNGAEEPKEEAAAEQPAAEQVPEPAEEKPRDPEPTPVIEEPPKQAAKPAAPTAPVKPAAPKTWASLAASAHKVAMPAAPSAAPATAPTQSAKPAKSAPTATLTQSTSAATPAPAAQREASPAAASGDEWTAVSGSHNRQQSRQVNGQQQQQQEPSHPRGYIKNVQENIKGPELKEKLQSFGEINYFDIYRAKSCAFVDFKTPDGYKNALAASPFQIGDEKFWIEERRNRPAGNQQGQQQFNGQRGNFQQGQRGGRGNFRGDGGRGGFGQRGGRGGAGGAARGRGGANAA